MASPSPPPPAASPRLASVVRGSGFQFMCATMPFLALFIYFLYLAAIRPSVYQSNQENNNADDIPAIIPLTDILLCFLAFLCLFSMLAVYLLIFVPKRRNLMKSYLESGDTVMGDVFYEGTKHRYGSFSKYAYAMYAHPVHPKQWLVRKRVRCFQHFTRERVTILLLPYHPFSGQPKTDVEMDLAASEESRRDTNKVLYCLIAWIIFLLVAPLYLLHQMNQIQDDYDDPKRGLTIYLVMVLGVAPLLSFGGNYLRWRLHRHWIMNRGVVIELQKPVGGAGETQVRVAQNDCGALACMGYSVMEDDVEEPAAPPNVPPSTRTEATEATAFNSVYMA